MRLLRWYVARWLIHLGLHIAPPGAAKDAIEHSIRRTGIYMMAALAAHQSSHGSTGDRDRNG